MKAYLIVLSLLCSSLYSSDNDEPWFLNSNEQKNLAPISLTEEKKSHYNDSLKLPKSQKQTYNAPQQSQPTLQEIQKTVQKLESTINTLYDQVDSRMSKISATIEILKQRITKIEEQNTTIISTQHQTQEHTTLTDNKDFSDEVLVFDYNYPPASPFQLNWHLPIN
jgi:peptidoglycan hydrolase CwlO-like protein